MVDDHASCAKALARLLSYELRADVAVAKTAAEAEDLAGEFHPDAVVLDTFLDGMSDGGSNDLAYRIFRHILVVRVSSDVGRARGEIARAAAENSSSSPLYEECGTSLSDPVDKIDWREICRRVKQGLECAG